MHSLCAGSEALAFLLVSLVAINQLSEQNGQVDPPDTTVR